MKKAFSIIRFLIGCLLVALSLNFLILPNKLFTFGVLGVSTIINYVNGANIALNCLIINLIGLLIGLLLTKEEVVKKYIASSLLIPLFIYLTSFLSSLYVIKFPEMVLVVIIAGFLNGIGYSMIYKEGYASGIVFLFEEIIGNLTHFHSKIYSWIIDFIIVFISAILFDYQIALYSLIIIIISKYLITRERFGINDSKIFYIITYKSSEIKDFIMNDLHYELTILDAKGGFTKRYSEVLLSVIATEDFYKAKEGIKTIDPKAFIAITDTYDVVSNKYLK